MSARASRIIRRALIALVVACVVCISAGSTLYWLASSQPVRYAPMELSGPQQDESIHEFFYRVQEFGNQAGAGKDFTWVITADQINAYLASMDAIAALTNKPIHPSQEMRKRGLSAPAVAIHDGVLTIMVHLDKYDKVASADVAMEYNDQGELTTKVLAMHVGLVLVPQSYLEQGRKRAADELAKQLAATEKDNDMPVAGAVSLGKISKVLSRVMDMLNGQYVRPELTWPLGRHRVLIDQVVMTEGQITIHATPADRAKAASASVGPPPFVTQTAP